MIDFFSQYYLLIKVIHIVAMVAWMAGVFYLPRLFVYHCDKQNSEIAKTFIVMEEKLYRIIMKPAMHTTLLTGILLVLIRGDHKAIWVLLKLCCVFLLIMFQFYLDRCRLELAAGQCEKEPRFFRIINEIPTLLLILIVICVVFKPF